MLFILYINIINIYIINNLLTCCSDSCTGFYKKKMI